MQVAIDDTRDLVLRVLAKCDLRGDGATAIADHLVDAHCAGHTYAGLSRLLVLLDRLQAIPKEDLGRIEVVKEDARTVWIDGRGNLGYITCQRAIEIGIEKAQQEPLVLIGAFNTNYSGRLGYYAEQGARAGLITFHTNSVSPMVVAPGASQPTLGTNPMCIAFPTSTDPLVCDLNTAAMTRGAVDLAAQVGATLPEGQAVDKFGRPTTDPRAAQEGGILTFGGHKGFALSLMVASLGIFAGGDPIPDTFGNWGFFFALFRSDAFVSSAEFEKRMDVLVNTVRDSTSEGRVPGDQTRSKRKQARDSGMIDVPEEVWNALDAFAA
jgi:L-2-hydroxycarboxylate dehydrogenase (NAD+)